MVQLNITNLLFYILVLDATCVQLLQAKPLSGKKKSFGVGFLGGALAGAYLNHKIAKTLNANHSKPQVPQHPITTIEKGETLPNGCYKRIIKEHDPHNANKYTETEQLICPGGAGPIAAPLDIPHTPPQYNVFENVNTQIPRPPLATEPQLLPTPAPPIRQAINQNTFYPNLATIIQPNSTTTTGVPPLSSPQPNFQAPIKSFEGPFYPYNNSEALNPNTINGTQIQSETTNQTVVNQVVPSIQTSSIQISISPGIPAQNVKIIPISQGTPQLQKDSEPIRTTPPLAPILAASSLPIHPPRTGTNQQAPTQGSKPQVYVLSKKSVTYKNVGSSKYYQRNCNLFIFAFVFLFFLI